MTRVMTPETDCLEAVMLVLHLITHGPLQPAGPEPVVIKEFYPRRSCEDAEQLLNHPS
jgi:hypothetical protein